MELIEVGDDLGLDDDDWTRQIVHIWVVGVATLSSPLQGMKTFEIYALNW